MNVTGTPRLPLISPVEISWKVWDARPWTRNLKAEYEARGRLLSLRARFGSIDELRQVIGTDKTIAEPVRKLALKWAEDFWEGK